jgi:predicted CoA-binding protein
MADLFQLLDDPSTTIAVVGATDAEGKYGGRIYRDLKEKGYRVLAVHPRRKTVDGDPAYPSLAELPESPDIVDIVVPPAVTLRILEEAKSLGHTKVWVQPGAEDDTVLEYLHEHGFHHVAGGPCIMVESRRH